MVFDPNLYFIICINTLGSPYGSASPLTVNSLTNSIYGPDFPYVTIRDTVKMQKMLLDIIGISDVCVAIGGSMGGMQVLEWGIMYPKIVKCLIPIACSGRHNAWAISSAEIQRLCITNDPNFHGVLLFRIFNLISIRVNIINLVTNQSMGLQLLE